MKTLADVIQNRQIVGILGFVGLLWISTQVFSSLRIALNIVFGAEKRRAMLRGIVVDLLMIVLVGILLFVSMILGPFVYLPSELPGADSRGSGADDSMDPEIPAPFFLTCCMFFLIYKIVPNRKVSFQVRPSGGPLCRRALGVGQTSFRLVCPPSGPVLSLLRLIKHLGHFRFVGILFFDDSRCWRGVCLLPGRRSAKTRRPDMATQIKFVGKIWIKSVHQEVRGGLHSQRSERRGPQGSSVRRMVCSAHACECSRPHLCPITLMPRYSLEI